MPSRHTPGATADRDQAYRPATDPAATGAAAEVAISSGDLFGGFLTERGIRRVRGEVAGIPASMRLIVRLPAACREPDELLCEVLAALPCRIDFIGYWRVAVASQQLVTQLRAEVAS